jgi:predicted extracellular nuclease
LLCFFYRTSQDYCFIALSIFMTQPLTFYRWLLSGSLALVLAAPARAQAPASSGQSATSTHIGQIQGSGAAATPGTYTIEGIVTGVYTGLKPSGFYVQEATARTDGNPATSDALFVVQPTPSVRVGDQVRVTGIVLEIAGEPSFDQAVLTGPTVQVLSSGNALPAFTTLNNTTFQKSALEPYEGMRVQFTAPLTVADVYNLKQRGELLLSTGGTLFQPTQFIDPNDAPATGTHSTGSSNVAAVKAYEAANLDKSITLDDGTSELNPKVIPYLDPKLGTVRVGSVAPSLQGILGFAFGKWRVQPLTGAEAPVFKVSRPAAPTFGSVDLKLASFNVLNYFNGDGAGGGFPTPRGAKTAADFARQRRKIIAALAQMNADVVGLMEMENDGTGPTSAVQDLVNGLNQVMGAGTYTFVNDGGATQQPNNTDVIHCAIIYKPAAVAPLGTALVASVTGVFERPPLAQLFTTRRHTRPDTLALVVNHFKSKASGKDANADQNDGQGGSNDRRRLEAHALVQFINKTVVPAGATRVICIGDYNANYEEDPIDILRAAGFVAATPPTSASYVFKGLTGSLDHCIITPSLLGFVDVQKWHINSGEPAFLEYDQAGEATDASPFRSSDHDPVLIGVRFLGIASASSGASSSRLLVYPNPTTGATPFRLAKAVPTTAGTLTLEFFLLQGKPLVRMRGTMAVLQSELGRYTAHLAPGIYLVRLQGKGFDKTQRVMKD